MLTLRRFAAVTIVIAFVASLVSDVASSEPYEGFANYRSIFVDRFGDFPYTGEIPAMVSEINGIMQNAVDHGFTEVVWQVRGQADALYNSNVEPPIAGMTPGFDPLQTALDAAHARGLKLHAWVNATPLWRGSSTPPAGHIFHNTSPSFRIQDIDGNLEPGAGWSNYSSVNPILPEVHAHINNVVSDIMANYEVDGIHLDYIRYIPGSATSAAFNRFPHDPISHAMFQDATGLDGGNIANFQAYKTYITDRITDLVRSIKDNVDAAEVTHSRPMELTASVFFEPNRGKNEYMQDWGRWIDEGLLDVAMPMIYLSQLNDELFDPYLSSALSFVNPATGTRVAPTLASYLHMNPDRGGGVALTLEQIQSAHNMGAHGVGFYDYPAYFQQYSAGDRQQILNYFESIQAPPPPGTPGPGNVLDDFEVDEGHFGWVWNASPVSQTFGLASGPGGPAAPSDRVTQEHQGLGQASQLLNLAIDGVGDSAWQLRHNSGIGSVAHPSGNVPLAATGSVGFWLKTDDPGITVRIGIDDPVSAGATAIEMSQILSVIADNEWHLYQWSFEDDGDWEPFNAGTNGAIDAVNGSVSIDSIWLAGSGSAQIYLDTVSHNPNGPLAALVPGDYDRNGLIDAADYEVWRAAYGDTVAPGSGADGTNDGIVDAGDFLMWSKRMSSLNPGGSGSNSPIDGQSSVPEPGALALIVGAALALRYSRMV
jgi:uncharacterized lipoprotein YddW (UPF0748 family)